MSFKKKTLRKASFSIFFHQKRLLRLFILKEVKRYGFHAPYLFYLTVDAVQFYWNRL